MDSNDDALNDLALSDCRKANVLCQGIALAMPLVFGIGRPFRGWTAPILMFSNRRRSLIERFQQFLLADRRGATLHDHDPTRVVR
jgi:hypothetical protein